MVPYPYMRPYLLFILFLLGIILDAYLLYDGAVLLIQGHLMSAIIAVIAWYGILNGLLVYWAGLSD